MFKMHRGLANWGKVIFFAAMGKVTTEFYPSTEISFLDFHNML